MALLTFGSSSAVAVTSESQANIGLATTLGMKFRVSGAMLLAGASTGSIIVLIWDGASGATTRAQLIAANAGGQTYVLVGGPGGADGVTAVTASSNYSSGAQYDIRVTYGAAGRSVGVYTTAGVLVASGSDTGFTLPSADADNGIVQLGSISIAPAGAMEGGGIYNQAPPANSNAPRATDTGILWAVLDNVVGQLVSGATDLDTLDGDASWGSGGTWEPPPPVIEADTEEGAEAGEAVTRTVAAARSVTAGAESGESSTAARGTSAAVSAGAASGDAHAADTGKPVYTTDGAVSGESQAVLAALHAGATEAAESDDTHTAALATAASTGDGAEAGESQQAAVGDLFWGFLGDSQTDSYQDPSHGPELTGRGPPHQPITPGGPGGVLNWLEILVHADRINPGAWGSFSEPRRDDYAYNWARSGAQSPGVISDQLSGLAAQVAAGTVTHAAFMAPGNDWLNLSGPLYAVTIYNGDGTEDSEGTPLTDIIATVVGWHQTIMDAIDSALDTAESGGGMVVMTPQDYMAAPPAWGTYPSATRRGYVTGVIEAIHSQVAAYAAGLNSTAGYTRFSVIRADHYLLNVWGTASGDYLTISGAQVDMTTPWEYDAETYDPYTLALAATGGLQHAGTLMGGEYARAFLHAANQLTGVQIQPLTNAEILRAAGIPVGETADGAEAGDAQGAALEAAVSTGEGAEADAGFVAALDAISGHTEGAEADESQTGVLQTAGAIAGGAEAGEAAGATLATAAGTAEGAESADTHDAVRVTAAATVEGAEAGDAMDAPTSGAAASVSEGAEAGDSQSATLSTSAATSEGAEAGEASAGLIGNVGAMIARAASGDAHAVTYAGLAGTTEGAEAGESQAAALATGAAVTAGAEAADAHEAAIGNVSRTSEEAEAGDVQAAIAELLASLPEMAESGDSWDVVLTAAASVTDGAVAGDSHRYPPSALPPYSATLTVTSPRPSLSVTARRASLTVTDA